MSRSTLWYDMLFVHPEWRTLSAKGNPASKKNILVSRQCYRCRGFREVLIVSEQWRCEKYLSSHVRLLALSTTVQEALQALMYMYALSQCDINIILKIIHRTAAAITRRGKLYTCQATCINGDAGRVVTGVKLAMCRDGRCACEHYE